MKKGLLNASLLGVVLLLFSLQSKAERLKDRNTIGWYGTYNTIHVNEKVSLYLEYQWRRDNLVTDWQQLFTRGGIQYHFSKDISVMAGYAYALTYSYGDYHAGSHPIPEHRIFEQISWNDEQGRVDLNHRIRLEQRYLGKINQDLEEAEVHGWNYVNRVRYQLRASVPVNNKEMTDDTWYAAAYDELFIGFGKTVNQNIFDQNRIGILAGYQFNRNWRAEAGYLNVIQQQGALVDSREVVQYNNGVIVNFYFTLR